MPRASLGLKKINFYLEPTVLQGFKWLATARGTTYSDLLRLAAKEFIIKEIKAEQENIEVLAVTAAEGSDERDDDFGSDS